MAQFLRAACVFALCASLAGAAVLATINGETITSEEINALLSQSQQPLTYEQLSDEDKKKVLDEVIDRRLLSQQARKDGIEGNADYKIALEMAKENLAVNLWIKNMLDALSVSDKEAKAFYNDNKARFQEQPEQVHALHILLDESSEARAKEIIKELNGKKASARETAFREIAKSSSIDASSAQNGGDLGYFQHKQMVKEFSDAAFALKKGELSKQPVKSNFGYHIIYLVDKRPAGVVPYENVAEQMKNAAKMKKLETKIEQIVSDLKKKAAITYPK
ncbi:MAG: peptidylprolyl isomerase [Helicobacteraceae bacterium]|jgi:peptidylprolyl isomerase|nr:peptidylprolyl isomerase [Helicobacteraceae bacterium]